MEEGSFRCDANVSIRPKGSKELGTKAEVKNMNSFKAVEKALEYEIRRQEQVLSEGGRVVQETLHWDADREVTRSMRSKEHAHDYRYFPDPDLLPLVIDESWIQEISENMPELPEARKNRFMADYSLPNYDAELLTSRKDIADYYEAAVKVHSNPKAISNWIVGDLFRVIKERKLDERLRITSWPVRAEHMGEMVRMIDQGKISGKIAKTLFEEMLDKQVSPEKLVKEKGLEQVTDLGSIEKDVDQVLAAHSQQVADYRAGKDKVFGFLVGQVMKATKGKANPKIVNEILQNKLHGQA